MTFELFYQTIYCNHRIHQATAINLSHANYSRSHFFFFLIFYLLFTFLWQLTKKSQENRLKV